MSFLENKGGLPEEAVPTRVTEDDEKFMKAALDMVFHNFTAFEV